MKKISPIQAREQRVKEITGITPDKITTGIIMGAIAVDVDPEFTLWCGVRDARRKSDRPALTKAQAQKIARRKVGRDAVCCHPDGKKYVFAIYEHLASGAFEIGRGPSWEAAIDAAVKTKRGEQ